MYCLKTLLMYNAYSIRSPAALSTGEDVWTTGKEWRPVHSARQGRHGSCLFPPQG